MQPGIDSGLVPVVYDPPQEIEVDQHFHKIEQIIVALMKEHQVAAVYNNENPECLGCRP